MIKRKDESTSEEDEIELLEQGEPRSHSEVIPLCRGYVLKPHYGFWGIHSAYERVGLVGPVRVID